MLNHITAEHLEALKNHNVQIFSLDEYKKIINPMGFDINVKRLKDFACANSHKITEDLTIHYNTSSAVLSEKLNGELVGFSNIKGYEIMKKDDQRRKDFNEFRKTEPYILFENKLWII